MKVAAKSFQLTIPHGGAEIHVAMNECQYVRCTENNGGDFQIALDDGDAWQPFTGGQEITAPAGQVLHTVRLRQFTGAPLTVELRAGAGGFADDRLKFTGNVAVANTYVTPLYTLENVPTVFGAAVVPIADATVGEMLAATNAARRKLTVKNPQPIGGADIYITGSATGDNTDSFPLAPQESVEISNTATIYCYQATGGALGVPVIEEE